MSLDTARLRENVAKKHIGLWVDPTGIILALCDELDQARADVLKLRDALRNHNCAYSWDVLSIDPCVYCTALGETEHEGMKS